MWVDLWNEGVHCVDATADAINALAINDARPQLEILGIEREKRNRMVLLLDMDGLIL